MSLSTSADPTSRQVVECWRGGGRALALDRVDASPAEHFLQEDQSAAIAERVQRPATGAGA